MAVLINELGWFALFIFQIAIAASFYSAYVKDNNKRKLIFSLGFLIISYSHFYEVITPSVFGQTPINVFTAIQYWSFLPLLFALAIAVHEKNLQKINSKNMFSIFSILCITSFFASIINPTLTTSYFGQITIIFGIEITLFAFYNS
ncbi:MAG: hypothetical protein R6U21_06010, partial [Thermoplasmatota archaeon]